MSEWTDELKQQIIKEYLAADPTPDNSIEIVEQLAEEHNKTVNGIRVILSKAEVYVKKSPASAGKTSDKPKSTRVSKKDAIADLVTAIEATGQEADEEIISKLTGKAAIYIAEVIRKATPETE